MIETSNLRICKLNYMIDLIQRIRHDFLLSPWQNLYLKILNKIERHTLDCRTFTIGD